MATINGLILVFETKAERFPKCRRKDLKELKENKENFSTIKSIKT